MRNWKGAKVVVIGMGRSGLAAVELLCKYGANVRAADNRPKEKLSEETKKLRSLGVELWAQAPETFLDADVVVNSPGVPVDLPLLNEVRSRGAEVIGEVELASFFLKGPVIGITGANGKTTTTALTGHILKESRTPTQVGGNIGTPPTAMVESSSTGQWNVLELSSFQLETISNFRANIAVCLNVTPDHLDRHHTFENYAAAKARLFETQRPDDFAVLNADDPTTVSYSKKTPGTTSWFSSSHRVDRGAWLENGQILINGELLLPAAEVPLRGIHNTENTMAAALAAGLAGVKIGDIANAVKTFPGVEHRLEFVRERGGVSYYNDSKATNVDATQKAIDAFAGGLWIILGGKDKDSDYTVLANSLRRKARSILLIGAAASKIEQQLHGAAPMIQCGTLDVAVQRAAEQAKAGEVVLLAPACASFDQFDNFEHRGRVFKDLVRGL
jgi:UDP-N-acetylmuramoylalanine--D-glutamate ligase